MSRQITQVWKQTDCRVVTGPIHDRLIALLDHDGVLTRGDHTVDVDKVEPPTDE